MARPMTARMAEHLRQRRPLAILALIEHPDGDAKFWSGVGLLRWNGVTWTGSGTLGTITPIKHTTNLVIQEIEFQMSGVDQGVVSRLSDDVRNLSGQAWLAGINDGNRVVDVPYQIVDSVLDYQNFSADDNGRTSISIIARSGFYTLERAIDEAWTTEEQKVVYPNDSGLDLIPSLQDQDIQWTRE